MSRPAPRFYTSPLSQFCAEFLPGDFHFLDLDEVLLRYSSQGITFCRETMILRAIECKNPGEEIRRSQRDVLPEFAAMFHDRVKSGQLAQGTGVFIVEGRYPYHDGALVGQVLPRSESKAVGLQQLGPWRFTGQQIYDLVRCRMVRFG